ncbi:uroporphyrinogen-III C-methyltransferase [Vreelandella jeotgali]|uniref:uroporphyrinogen-III C-methyltransferase n=1 Tax=Vreelandella jeotgali TaxID=553386 RepID=UPI000348C5C7|nr:uroporphyrinogen-III C-methyltransferase [Halomonas jeotgali]
MNQHSHDQDEAPKADDAKRNDVTQGTTPDDTAAASDAPSNKARHKGGKGKGNNRHNAQKVQTQKDQDKKADDKADRQKAGNDPRPGDKSSGNKDSGHKNTGNKNSSNKDSGDPKPEDKKPGDNNRNDSRNTGGGGGGQPPQNAKAAGGSKAGLLAILLVLIVAAALAFLAWQGWQRLQSQQQRLDSVAEEAVGSASKQRVDDLASRLESGEKKRSQKLDNTLGSLRSEFSDYRQSMDKTLDKVLTQLSQEQDTDERDWLHAEAAYLLRLANQRLQFEGDVQGAAALLNSADQRLEDADNPALTPVRRRIADEISRLDAVPNVDRTGLYLALDAQQERIRSLHLDQDVEAQKAESDMDEAPEGPFPRQLARFGEELKDLVVVRQHDEGLETLVTPEQEAYLGQSLRLMMEQAQLALLKQEQTLFEGSIDDALELINGYYDTDRPDTQGVISRLEELKQTSIKPELPDISGSQQALAEFIDKRFEARRESGGGA